jgi:purine-binding chemotaxis protein CheW
VTSPTPSALAGEYVVFALGGSVFAVAARDVREVVLAVRIAPLPGAPEVVEGLVNVRGVLAPVFDLRKRFGLPSRPLDSDEHLVLATAGGRLVAFRADRVLAFARFAPESVEGAAEVVDGLERLVGVAKTSEGLVLIHDLATFLSSAEVVVLEAAVRDARDAQSEAFEG